MPTMLILSLFPGIDLLGRGFELEGFCVVRGPDLIWGGDIRDFHAPHAKFDGIIGGSPCQDFSKARRSAPTGYGLEMLTQFARVVGEARPAWFLLENVPTVPDIEVSDYTIQRLDLNARECGSAQNRLRHLQFGSLTGMLITPHRSAPTNAAVPICLATEGTRKDRRTWEDFCEAQGLPRSFDVPGLSVKAKYAAVGNGVPIQMARTIAQAIQDAYTRTEQPAICACGCGRVITGKQVSATPACRKRIERRKRDGAARAAQSSVTLQLCPDVRHATPARHTEP